jgi:hypothetical protein
MNANSKRVDQIRVTRNITYGQILPGDVTHPQVLNAQATEWLIRPAKHLATLRDTNRADTDHGIALLSLIMLFFEPHGQYLSGQDSVSKSNEKFSTAFKRFLQWLHHRNRLDQPASSIKPSEFYKLAKCGLLHSAQLKGEFLVDAINSCDKAIMPNTQLGSGWLVNPWILLVDLEACFADYLQGISNESSPDYPSLYPPFEATFQRLVLDVLKTYFSAGAA